MNRVKRSSTGKDRQDREQVNSPEQCPVRLRTKAHREKRGQRRGRSRAWDGWGGQSRGRGGHSEGCGRTGPRSESHRGGTERLGQPPRRPGHAGAAVTGKGRGRREGAGNPPAAGQILLGRAASGALPHPDGGEAFRVRSSRPPRSGPARGSGAGSTSGPGSHHRRPRAPGPVARPGEERQAGGRARPDRPFPRSPRRDSVPGPAPPPSRPAGPGRAGPGLAATQRRGLPALTSIARPAESGPRPPAPSASAGPGSAAAASPRRGPGIVEAPPLAAAPPRLTAGGEPGLRLPAPAGPGGAGPWPRPPAEPARPHEPLGGRGRPAGRHLLGCQALTCPALPCPRGRCSHPSPS
nr:uncharacterized protein LOC106629342 [Zonotrichia albicollis]